MTEEILEAGDIVLALHETYGWPLVAARNEEGGLLALAVERPDGLFDFGLGPSEGVTKSAAAALLTRQGVTDDDEPVDLKIVTLPEILEDDEAAFSVSSAALSLCRAPAAESAALVPYAERWPLPAVEGGARILVVVHPGSALGSANFNLGRADARAARETLAEEIAGFDGHVVVIHGGLSSELSDYPIFDRALRGALNGAHAKGRLAAEMYGCDNTGPHHPDAARRLVGRFPALRGCSIVCTGAWATEDNSSGCVNDVADSLRAAGCGNVNVSDRAVYMVDEPEDDLEEEDGFHP